MEEKLQSRLDEDRQAVVRPRFVDTNARRVRVLEQHDRYAGGSIDRSRPQPAPGEPGETPAEAAAPPVVVLLGGCGVAATYWSEVLQLLPDVAALALDRPGLGGSPWPRRIPSLAEEIATLHALVSATGRRAVLVGHSMAAFHAEAFARSYPELTAGLVVVDGSVEFLVKRPRTPGDATARAIHRLVQNRPTQFVASLVHRAGAALQSTHPGTLLTQQRLRVDYDDSEAVAMAIGEYASYFAQAWDLLQLRVRFGLPSVPALVLSAESSGERHASTKHRRLASLLNGRFVLVEQSAHMMMFDQPDAISAAIRGVLAAAGGGPWQDDVATPIQP